MRSIFAFFLGMRYSLVKCERKGFKILYKYCPQFSTSNYYLRVVKRKQSDLNTTSILADPFTERRVVQFGTAGGFDRQARTKRT